MAAKSKPAKGLEAFGEPVALNADGSIDCRGCGYRITFLPEHFPAAELPEGAPQTVNHTGCPAAVAGESPAPPSANPPFHSETINVIDKAEVAEFYKDRAAFSKKRGGK